MNAFVRFAFRQFYTTFAWTYDAVAHMVSLGEWKEWGHAAMQFLPREGRLLEIAHGPGHLHLALRQVGYNAVGIDLSLQMCRMLRTRLIHASTHPPQQARASTLNLPFADSAFTAVVSTFPAEFIFVRDTLNEVRRVLQPGGHFVIVPGTRFRGDDLVTRLIRFAYAATGQRETPRLAAHTRFTSAGFAFEEHIVQTRRAEVIVWVLTRH